MHVTKVTLKDGRYLEGPLWTFRPKEGFLELAVDNFPEGKVFFRDIQTAIEEDVMVNITTMKDVDLLQRARDEGWDGT